MMTPKELRSAAAAVLGRKGGKARAKKYDTATLAAWGRMGAEKTNKARKPKIEGNDNGSEKESS